MSGLFSVHSCPNCYPNSYSVPYATIPYCNLYTVLTRLPFYRVSVLSRIPFPELRIAMNCQYVSGSQQKRGSLTSTSCIRLLEYISGSQQKRRSLTKCCIPSPELRIAMNCLYISGVTVEVGAGGPKVLGWRGGRYRVQDI
jgi:hypothetical protein